MQYKNSRVGAVYSDPRAVKAERLQEQSSADSTRKGNTSQQILKVSPTGQSGWGSRQLLSGWSNRGDGGVTTHWYLPSVTLERTVVWRCAAGEQSGATARGTP